MNGQYRKDIYPGLIGSSPQYLVNVNGVAYFAAFDPTNGQELWRSDGTTAGTFLVKDIYAGIYSSNPQYITLLNNQILFSANDGVSGIELWKSDGTNAGTKLITDINQTTTPSSNPSYLTAFNNKLFFSAFDNEHGNELWKSDGSEPASFDWVDLGTSLHNRIVFNLDSLVVDESSFFDDADGDFDGREGLFDGTDRFDDPVGGPGRHPQRRGDHGHRLVVQGVDADLAGADHGGQP